MMQTNSLIALAACLLWQVNAFHTMCLTSPLITLEAGQSELSAVLVHRLQPTFNPGLIAVQN